MGRWLAEFQENSTEMPMSSTANTDKSPLMSVMAVQAQGHLDGKTEISDDRKQDKKDRLHGEAEQNLIEAACRGLEITPVQFTAICSEEDLDDISAGRTPLEDLRAYAASFADGIRTGRIVIHPRTQELIRHITACQWNEEKP